MKPLYTQHATIPEQYINDCFDRFLNEDQAHRDLSTQFATNKHTSVCAHFIAEEPLIFAGEPILRAIFKKFDIQYMAVDGQACMAGDVLGSIKAPADIMLSYERVLLNLMQRLSGIAFLTSQYIQKLNSSEIKILDTRKTTPGIRLFEKYAVNVGGGHNHRLDLYQGIMLKDNHLSLIHDLEKVIFNIHTQHPNKKIQIEIDYIDQLKQHLKPQFPIDAILLDNMDRGKTIQCVQYIKENWPLCFIESSGGINLKNIQDYIGTGIHAISIGALTHQAVSKNIKLEFEK